MAAKSEGTLNPEDLRRLLDNAIKLAAENKVTRINAWDLKFNEHINDVIHNEVQGEDFNFQRVSSGLEAGALIWSKRVEATFQTACQSLHGLTGAAAGAGNDDDNEGGGDAAAGGDQAEGTVPSGAGRKGRNKAGAGEDMDATLASADTLKAKKGGMTFDNDPLFRRTTQLFDENSASGLLLLNYPVLDQSHIIFDGNAKLPVDAGLREPMPAPPTKAAMLSGDILSLISSLCSAPPPPMTPDLDLLLKQTQAGQRRTGPLLNNDAMLKPYMIIPVSMPASQQGGAGAALVEVSTAEGVEGTIPEDASGTTPDVDMGGGFPDDDGDALEWGELEDVGFIVGEGQGGIPRGIVGEYVGAGGAAQLGGRWADMMDDGDGEESEGEGGQTQANWLDNLSLGPDASQNSRPAAAVWSYRAKPAAAKKPAAYKPKAQKQRVVPDFSGPVMTHEDMLPLLTTERVTKKLTKTVTHSTPATTLYQESQLYLLSTGIRPQDMWKLEINRLRDQNRRPCPHDAVHMNAGGRKDEGYADTSQENAWGDDNGGTGHGHGSSGENGYDGEEPGGAWEGDYDMGAGLNIGGGDGAGLQAGGWAGEAIDPLSMAWLQEAPNQRVAPVKVDHTAKQVDVRALKMKITDKLKAHADHNQREQTFRKIVEDLHVGDAALGNKDVTVHLTFICLLHAANEEGLVLKNEGQLDRLDISWPQRMQAVS